MAVFSSPTKSHSEGGGECVARRFGTSCADWRVQGFLFGCVLLDRPLSVSTRPTLLRCSVLVFCIERRSFACPPCSEFGEFAALCPCSGQARRRASRPAAAPPSA